MVQLLSAKFVRFAISATLKAFVLVVAFLVLNAPSVKSKAQRWPAAQIAGIHERPN